MIIWIDAQLSPAIAAWLSSTFSLEALAVRDLQLRDAKDTASNYLGYLWEYFQCAVERDSHRCISKGD